MFKHILLATDGSPASEHAAAIAVGMARLHGAKLTVVYVVDPYLSMGGNNPYSYQAYMTAAQEQAGTAHATVKTLCMQASPFVEMQALMNENVGASVGIVEASKSEGADLIVVGSHGRTGITRLVLGSVSSKVVAESPVPVLVVR
jgi:nucleotide-binding universal stress UspA family protein